MTRIVYKVILFFIAVNFLYSQDNQDLRKHFYYPEPAEKYEILSAIGLSIGKIPKFIVDDQINQSPMLFGSVRLGLFYNLSLNASVNTNYLTNHFTLGPGWHFSYKKLSLSLADNFAYWFGSANFDNFNVSINGWMNNPSLSVGYDLTKVLATFKAELTIVSHITKYVGDETVQTKKGQVVGTSFSFLLEQPLWKQNYVILGLKLNYTKYYYQSWLAFSTREQWLVIPEFSIGYII